MGNLYVISGPSGSGKSTICKRLAEEDDKIKISVSATTRAAREGEKDGVNYFFLSEKEFERKVKNGDFYEYAGIFKHRYGTLKEHVDGLMAEGCDVVLEIDVQGAAQVRKKNKDAILIFIMPPSEEELVKRLINRNTDSEQQLKIRLETAKSEMEKRALYDYVVVNDDLEKACGEIAAIIKKHR